MIGPSSHDHRRHGYGADEDLVETQPVEPKSHRLTVGTAGSFRPRRSWRQTGPLPRAYQRQSALPPAHPCCRGAAQAQGGPPVRQDGLSSGALRMAARVHRRATGCPPHYYRVFGERLLGKGVRALLPRRNTFVRHKSSTWTDQSDSIVAPVLERVPSAAAMYPNVHRASWRLLTLSWIIRRGRLHVRHTTWAAMLPGHSGLRPERRENQYRANAPSPEKRKPGST